MEKFFKFIGYSICVIIAFCMLDCMCSSCLGCDSCVGEFCYEACGIDCSDGCMDACDGCGDGCSGGCEVGCDSCMDSCQDSCTPPPETMEYVVENGHEFAFMPSWNYCVYSDYVGSDTVVTIPEKCGNRPVTKISSYAFNYDSNITKITLPSSVTAIEGYAFQNCRNLREVEMPGVKTISSYAFNGCSSMQTVKLPATLERLDDNVFYGCSYLRTAQYEGTLAQWCTNITFNSGSLFDYIDALYIGGEVVYDLKITSDVTHISKNAFNGYALNSVEIDQSATLTEIGADAFANCELLTLLKIDGAVDTIKSRAFSNCPALRTINLNKNVKKFEEFVFYGTSNIDNVIYAGYINDWCAIDFNYNSSTDDVSSNPLSQAKFFKTSNGYEGDLDIPHSVEIKPFAFAGAKMITSVRTRRNVTIGNYAFYSCENLSSVVTEEVGEGVTRINPYAFKDCTSLESVTIGANVRSIEESAFSSCTSLMEIYIPQTVLSMGAHVFENCYSIKLYCQVNSLPNGWYYNWYGSTNNVFWGASKPEN